LILCWLLVVPVQALIASACRILRLPLEWVAYWVTPGAADGLIVVTFTPGFTLTFSIFLVLLLFCASPALELVLNDVIGICSRRHVQCVKTHGIGLSDEESED